MTDIYRDGYPVYNTMHAGFRTTPIELVLSCFTCLETQFPFLGVAGHIAYILMYKRLIPQWGTAEYKTGHPLTSVLHRPKPTVTYIFSCGSGAEGTDTQ